MASKSLQTPAPSIVTADGKPLRVGDTVYRVHTRCCKKNLPTIERMKVIQLDLSSRRKVRLRTIKGIESEWTSNEPFTLKSSKCNNEPKELLYSSRAVAVKVAKQATKSIIKELEEKVVLERRALTTNLHNNHQDIIKAANALKGFKQRVSNIGK